MLKVLRRARGVHDGPCRGQRIVRVVGPEFGALLGLPIEEKSAPNIIEL
jgi:hypothetical protein